MTALNVSGLVLDTKVKQPDAGDGTISEAGERDLAHLNEWTQTSGKVAHSASEVRAAPEPVKEMSDQIRTRTTRRQNQ